MKYIYVCIQVSQLAILNIFRKNLDKLHTLSFWSFNLIDQSFFMNNKVLEAWSQIFHMHPINELLLQHIKKIPSWKIVSYF